MVDIHSSESKYVERMPFADPAACILVPLLDHLSASLSLPITRYSRSVFSFLIRFGREVYQLCMPYAGMHTPTLLDALTRLHLAMSLRNLYIRRIFGDIPSLPLPPGLLSRSPPVEFPYPDVCSLLLPLATDRVSHSLSLQAPL